MNEYRKKELKKTITAFLLSAGLLTGASAAVCLLVFIGVILGAALPYVVLGICVFAVIWILSIPIKDILQDRENRKLYWEHKDRERKRNNWKPN